MEFAHQLSSITPLSEYDIFGVPPTQTTVELDKCFEYRPISTLSSKAFIEFNLTSAIDEYIVMNETMLQFKMRVIIEKPLGAKVAHDDWKSVSPVNNLLASLFKQVDLTIGDRTVTRSYQTYGYKCDIETKLGTKREAKKSFLTAQLWYEDDKEKLDGINQIRSNFITPAKESNDADYSVGRELDMIGRVNLDMFEQVRPLIGGCSVKLKFIPNDPAFYMMCASGVRIKDVEFTEAVLFVHKAKISRLVVEAHLKALAIANAKYPIRRGIVVPHVLNKGSLDILVDNVYTGQLPRRAFFGMVSHNAYNGSFNLNPYNYQHFNMNYLALYLDGNQYPEKAFQPDFENGNYIREYMSLFEATNQLGADSSIDISRSDYPKGNAIVGFNFAPDLATGCCSSGHLSRVNHGTMRLHVRFAKPLTETINALLYLEFDNIIEINHERNPIFDFS
jgi:hypothetical protein